METVNVQCGHCGKLMAVSTEHLGARVSCPHCQGVVEAPSAPRPTPAADDPPEIKVSVSETESIFASGEAESGDDLFGMDPQPMLEMPAAPAPAAPAPSASAAAPALGPGTELASPEPLSPLSPLEKSGDGAVDGGGLASWPQASAAPDAGAVPEQLGQRRYVAKRSLLVPIVFMFLVPYCLFTTGFIAWLLYNRARAPDPFEYLKDPAPGKDGPEKGGKGARVGERIKYDARLPAKLRTPLGKSLQIGDVQVTPLKVVRSDGDLAIQLSLRNTSSDTTFNPLPNAYADLQTFRPNKPYTFLDAGNEDYVFGGAVTYQRQGRDLFQTGRLAPGEETVATLTTTVGERAHVANILRAKRSALVWRIQIRRGLVTSGGSAMPATAVIGVEFPISAIN